MIDEKANVAPTFECTHPILYHEFSATDKNNRKIFSERRCTLCGKVLHGYGMCYEKMLEDRRKWMQECEDELKRIGDKLSLFEKLEQPEYNRYVKPEPTEPAKS